MTRPLTTLVCMVLLLRAPVWADVLHVQPAGGPGPGTAPDWSDAFGDLQDALAAAQPGDSIWVAAGTYTPGDHRDDAFELVAGVDLFGGFAGSETLLREADPERNATVLSGDIGVVGDSQDNSYHVVLVQGTASQPVDVTLDGFTITAGHADGTGAFVGSAPQAYERDRGGGAFISFWAAVTFSRCTIAGNEADGFGGGGVYNHNDKTTVTLDSCVVANNTAAGRFDGDGGGVYNHRGLLVAKSCTFRDNLAERHGGGLFISVTQAGQVHLDACTLSGNTAETGGGLSIWSAQPRLSNTVVVGNQALVGGGVYQFNDSSSSRLDGCVVSANQATGGAGGVHVTQGVLDVANGILWGNGGAVALPTQEQQVFVDAGASAAVTYSCVQDSLAGDAVVPAGAGNIDADPQFVGGADHRLSPGSPCIDAGQVGSIPADATDVDCDGDSSEPTPLDRDGRVRRHDDPATADSGAGAAPVVDMGAYEFGAGLPQQQWTDLGAGLAGTSGTPALVGAGSLCGSTPLKLDLSGAPASSSGWLVLGLGLLNAPFKGGTLGPLPDVVLPWPTSGGGGGALSTTWPSGLPSGFSVYLQWWGLDAGGTAGYTASNSLEAGVP